MFDVIAAHQGVETSKSLEHVQRQRENNNRERTLGNGPCVCKAQSAVAQQCQALKVSKLGKREPGRGWNKINQLLKPEMANAQDV